MVELGPRSVRTPWSSTDIVRCAHICQARTSVGAHTLVERRAQRAPSAERSERSERSERRAQRAPSAASAASAASARTLAERSERTHPRRAQRAPARLASWVHVPAPLAAWTQAHAPRPREPRRTHPDHPGARTQGAWAQAHVVLVRWPGWIFSEISNFCWSRAEKVRWSGKFAGGVQKRCAGRANLPEACRKGAMAGVRVRARARMRAHARTHAHARPGHAIFATISAAPLAAWVNPGPVPAPRWEESPPPCIWWPRPTESRFGSCSVSEKVFAERGGHVRPKVVSEAALSLIKCLPSDRKKFWRLLCL